MRKKTIIAFTSLFASLFVFLQLSAQNISINTLDDYFQNALDDWKVPGMAIGIIQNDDVLLAKGYGVKQSDKKAKVDANTLFPIASNTKAFTSAALASLVDQGLLSWDDKVIDHLAYFQLYNSYVSQEMTIRDLLCHRSGLKTFSGDLLWFNSDYSRRGVIERAKYLKPAHAFRTTYGYSNIMFIAAGEIIESVTGISWDQYLKDSFFIPLRMNRTNTSVSQLEKIENVAQPHNDVDGKVIPIAYQNWDNIGGAGAINSSVNDMIKWLQLQLHEGSIGERTFYSKENAWEMWSPHTLLPVSKSTSHRYPGMHFKAYGLGWAMFDYHGRKVINHSGGYDGMISYTCLVPEEKLAFVILTNKNSALYYPLVYKILDAFLSEKDRDWSREILEIVEANENYKDFKAKEEISSRIKDTEPSLALADYCGVYESELYGEAKVSLKEDKLCVQFIPSPLFEGELSHWHYNTFQIEMINFPSLPKGKAHFYIGDDAKVEELKIDIPNPDFDFTELKFLKVK
jgi:CubicO group peptidase (beta-lactamase class C family)